MTRGSEFLLFVLVVGSLGTVALFVLSLGPVGWFLIGFLALGVMAIRALVGSDESPDRTMCTACGSPNATDGETCTYCGEPL